MINTKTIELVKDCSCDRNVNIFPSEQEKVFDKYIKGENIFITGPGGTGKTYTIKKIVEHAKNNNKAFKVCALTGCAAVLLMCGAITLHAFAGIGLANKTIILHYLDLRV